MPYVMLIEAALTLPALQPFITAPGCRPGAWALLRVLCAVAPLLTGLRLLFVRERPKWLWAVVAAGPLAWVIPVHLACVPPL